MRFLNWIKSLFIGAFGAFLQEVFTDAKAKVIATIKDVAIKTVAELATTDLKSAEKRQAAFDKIKAYATEKGIEAGDSIINLTLEMAVSKLKG